jgi:hypothetical protein
VTHTADRDRGTRRDHLLREIRQAEEQIATASATSAQVDDLLAAWVEFAKRCDILYEAAPEPLRRQMNQAVFEQLFVEEDGSVTAEPAGPFQVLLNPHLLSIDGVSAGSTNPGAGVTYHRASDWSGGMPSWLAANSSGQMARLRLCEGSKEKHLAEVTGFEP